MLMLVSCGGSSKSAPETTVAPRVVNGYTIAPGANLRNANFTRMDLSGANLSGANLTGAYLVFTNLSGANLSNANLSFADVTGANLVGANLTNTIMPDGTIHP